MKCSHCERPLICARCNTPYEPAGESQYQASFEPETPIACPNCESALVCHWCGAPFETVEEDD